MIRKTVLILGEKYIFTSIDKEKLKNYHFHLISIKYNSKNTKQAIKEIKKTLKKEKNIFLVLNAKEKLTESLISYLNNIHIKGVAIIPIEEFVEKYLHKLYIPKYNENVYYLSYLKPYNKSQHFIKRVIDFSIAIPLAILSTPILIYSAYRIKKESPDGPILFKQKRVGKNGKEFVCYKFRSMKTDIDFFQHYTQENDPRIFPWGRIMRKTRIDEIPQLINVFRGEMHLIGPRAEWNELGRKYEKAIPFYTERYLVPPGITGWAQINYPYGRNLEDTYQKLTYDLYYIKNWSIWLEIKTILKTIVVMVKGKGL